MAASDRCFRDQTDSLRSLPFQLVGGTIPGYAIHWRFVERDPSKYSYFSGEKVSPFGRPRDPGWFLDHIKQEFGWDPSAPVQTLKGGEILLFFKNGEQRQVSFATHQPRLAPEGRELWRVSRLVPR